MSRYLDPKSDIVFKKIFGEHPHLLKSFLNAILPLSDDGQIESLEYLLPDQIPIIPAFKYTVVDVKCTDQQGRIFIVEMQMDWVAGFMERMLFNSAHAYIKQLQKGEHYVSLCPVYGLGIINALFEPNNSDWYHHYRIVNIQNPSKQLKGLELVFLELPKFKPLTKNEKYLRVLWLRFLSELGEKTRVVSPELLEVAEIREACFLSEEAAFSLGELAAYDKYWDSVSIEKTRKHSYEQMVKLATLEATLKGRLEGKLEGKIEGKQEGKLEGKIEIARNLIAFNMSSQDISSITGLSLEEIEILIKSTSYS